LHLAILIPTLLLSFPSNNGSIQLDMTISYHKRDLQHAQKIAEAEKYHILSFSDGANSAEHLVRVVELENDLRRISQQLNPIK